MARRKTSWLDADAMTSTSFSTIAYGRKLDRLFAAEKEKPK